MTTAVRSAATEVYHGLRRGADAAVYVATPTNPHSRMMPLPARTDLVNHSPAGFEWGYGGSGPAQLALALLARATGDERLALDLYQDFKREIIYRIHLSLWTLTQKDILDWVAGKQGKGGRS